MNGNKEAKENTQAALPKDDIVNVLTDLAKETVGDNTLSEVTTKQHQPSMYTTTIWQNQKIVVATAQHSKMALSRRLGWFNAAQTLNVSNPRLSSAISEHFRTLEERAAADMGLELLQWPVRANRLLAPRKFC